MNLDNQYIASCLYLMFDDGNGEGYEGYGPAIGS